MDQFKLCLANEENSVAVAAIKTLLHLIKFTKGTHYVVFKSSHRRLSIRAYNLQASVRRRYRFTRLACT